MYHVNEISTNKGDIELAIEDTTALTVFIIEYKVKKSPELAIQQMKDKQFHNLYPDQKVVYVGINVNSHRLAEVAFEEHCHIDPIGEVGKCLQDITTSASLSNYLKETFGGLRKFVDMYQNEFVVSPNHPFNPHVFLFKTLSPDDLALVSKGILPEAFTAKIPTKSRRNSRKKSLPHTGVSVTASSSASLDNESLLTKLFDNMGSLEMSKEDDAFEGRQSPFSFSHEDNMLQQNKSKPRRKTFNDVNNSSGSHVSVPSKYSQLPDPFAPPFVPSSLIVKNK
jgi:hypothetical protein